MSNQERKGRTPIAARQTGLSLIELMIALVLGLLVISAVSNVYIGTTRSARYNEGLLSLQENGRHGISTLQRGIRLAGYSPNERLDPFDIPAGDADTLVVRMRQAVDCNGQPTTASSGIAVNTYKMNYAMRHISCRGNSSVATDMPLIEGVDGFSVLYGMDEDADDFSETYVPYNPVLNSSAINSIRFALLVSSGSLIKTRQVSENHMVLDRQFVTEDRVSRRVFTSTVMLRNRR